MTEMNFVTNINNHIHQGVHDQVLLLNIEEQKLVKQLAESH